jgi:very-short-patch-repair endonuclease
MSLGLIGSGDNYIPYNPKLKDRSRTLRSQMTPAEKRLWFGYLQKHKINFTRQKPIDHFIVDFYSPELRLVIEVDGDSHFTEEGYVYDKERTDVLKSYSAVVLRFTNQEVMHSLEEVCLKIESIIQSLQTKNLKNTP